MTTIDEVLAKATPRRRTVRLCVDGAAMHELEGLLAAEDLDEAAVDAARARVAAGEVAFTFEYVGRSPWRTLVGEHPPSDEAKQLGLDFDPETLPPAAIAASCIDPPVTAEQVVELAERMDLTQFATLWETCRTLHVGDPRTVLR